MQSTARKNELPLDKMCLHCDVTKKQKDDFSAGPREGAYVHGIFMEGARWDVQQSIIMESKLKELYPQMPVINIRVMLLGKRNAAICFPSHSIFRHISHLHIAVFFFYQSGTHPGQTGST